MTKCNKRRWTTAAGAAVVLLAPLHLSAAVVMTEVMYDLEGADAGHEWVEILNTGEGPVDLTDWRFNDGSNHVLNVPPEKGGTGSIVLSVGGFAILADNASTFLADHAGFSGTVIDTVMSLANAGDTISLIDADGTTVDEILYTADNGAAGDGNTLHRSGVGWVAGAPTPGFEEGFSGLESSSGTGSDAVDASQGHEGGSVLQEAMVPSIRVQGGGGRTLVVGADTRFDAVGVGTKGEPLKGARYTWTFGDGGWKEGESVLYHYRYPGRYVVSVVVSVGKFSALDRFVVTALPAQVSITAATAAYVEVTNDSNRELDLSHWILSVGNKNVVLPEGTVMLAGATVRFPSEVTGFAEASLEMAKLLYPNGTHVIPYSESIARASSEEEKVDLPPKSTSIPVAKSSSVSLEEGRNDIPSSLVTKERTAMPAAPATSGVDSSFWAWAVAVLGVAGVGVLAVLVRRSNTSEADEYTIIE